MEMKNYEFITVKELSQRLKVPTGTIYFWVSSGKVPYLKFGKHIRFELEEVIKHFKSRPILK